MLRFVWLYSQYPSNPTFVCTYVVRSCTVAGTAARLHCDVLCCIWLKKITRHTRARLQCALLPIPGKRTGTWIFAHGARVQLTRKDIKLHKIFGDTNIIFDFSGICKSPHFSKFHFSLSGHQPRIALQQVECPCMLIQGILTPFLP